MKYNNQIHALKDSIENLKNKIVERIKVIKNEDKRLLNKIKQLELKNNDIRSEIVINKSVH